MKRPVKVIQVVLTGTVLVLFVWGIAHLSTKNSVQSSTYYSAFALSLGADEVHHRGHFIIYLDVNACLSCTEDMSIWNELEERLLECGYSFSIYSPPEDSFDVAYAMELEGLKTPVQLLSDGRLSALGWINRRTPIKILLDNDFGVVDIFYAPRNRKESRQTIEYVLSKICL